MSQENVEIVRRAFEAFRTNDFEALFAVVSPSVEVYPNPDEPGASSRHEGWEGMFDYLVNWYAGWEDYTVEPKRFIEAGDYVVVDAREIGIGESGIRVEQSFSHARSSSETVKSSSGASSAPSNGPSRPPGCRSNNRGSRFRCGENAPFHAFSFGRG